MKSKGNLYAFKIYWLKRNTLIVIIEYLENILFSKRKKEKKQLGRGVQSKTRSYKGKEQTLQLNVQHQCHAVISFGLRFTSLVTVVPADCSPYGLYLGWLHSLSDTSISRQISHVRHLLQSSPSQLHTALPQRMCSGTVNLSHTAQPQRCPTKSLWKPPESLTFAFSVPIKTSSRELHHCLLPVLPIAGLPGPQLH